MSIIIIISSSGTSSSSSSSSSSTTTTTTTTTIEADSMTRGALDLSGLRLADREAFRRCGLARQPGYIYLSIYLSLSLSIYIYIYVYIFTTCMNIRCICLYSIRSMYTYSMHSRLRHRGAPTGCGHLADRAGDAGCVIYIYIYIYIYI